MRKVFRTVSKVSTLAKITQWIEIWWLRRPQQMIHFVIVLIKPYSYLSFSSARLPSCMGWWTQCFSMLCLWRSLYTAHSSAFIGNNIHNQRRVSLKSCLCAPVFNIQMDGSQQRQRDRFQILKVVLAGLTLSWCRYFFWGCAVLKLLQWTGYLIKAEICGSQANQKPNTVLS